MAKFILPPECQGQIIEVSYACCGDVIVRRSRDRAEQTEHYAAYDIDDSDWEWYETYEPCNGEPPVAGSEWREITAQQAARLAGDE